MIDSLEVEKGKYKIVLEDNYEVNVYKHGELWVKDPIMPKMLIALIYQFQELERENGILRKELWARHGCNFGSKYGDDGEIQCGGVDFKRDLLEVILEHLHNLDIQRMIEYLNKEKTQ